MYSLAVFPINTVDFATMIIPLDIVSGACLLETHILWGTGKILKQCHQRSQASALFIFTFIQAVDTFIQSNSALSWLTLFFDQFKLMVPLGIKPRAMCGIITVQCRNTSLGTLSLLVTSFQWLSFSVVAIGQKVMQHLQELSRLL